MPLTETAHLQQLVDRHNQGDETARLQLVNLFYGRLCDLARKKLRYDFPILDGQHSSASVVNEAWIRLKKALEKTQIATATDFLCLAGYKIRLVLLDLAKKVRKGPVQMGEGGNSEMLGQSEPSDLSHNPFELAIWTELHEKVETLPEQERKVFEMHYYLGLPQVEVAEALGLHPKAVSRSWIAATERLAGWLRKGDL
jgi:RNA polymerase sigma factor (sigma-70 family)